MSAPRVIAGAAAAAFVAGALGAFASGVVSADDTTPTATVCVGPDGQLRYDEDGCRRPETQLTIVGEQGPQGEPGPRGEQGPQGERGLPGTPGGVSGYEVVSRSIDVGVQSLPSGNIVLCPSGKDPIGGGFDAEPGLVVHRSRPDGLGDGWGTSASNTTDSSKRLVVYAVCADTDYPF